MDEKMFLLWEKNRRQGKGKFVFAYGFTATLLGLIVLLIAKMFISISNSLMAFIFVGLGCAGTLLGLVIWSIYEKQYWAIVASTKKQN